MKIIEVNLSIGKKFFIKCDPFEEEHNSRVVIESIEFNTNEEAATFIGQVTSCKSDAEVRRLAFNRATC